MDFLRPCAMKAGEKMSNGEKRRKHGKDRNYKILKRILVLLVMFGVVVFLPIGWKLWDLQVIQHDTLEQEAIEQQTSELSINAQRGTIYDSQGNVLAISSTVYDVILSPKAIVEKQEELDEARRGIAKLGGAVEDVKPYDIGGAEHRVIIIRKVRPPPPTYPRRFAKIKLQPLS